SGSPISAIRTSVGALGSGARAESRPLVNGTRETSRWLGELPDGAGDDARASVAPPPTLREDGGRSSSRSSSSLIAAGNVAAATPATGGPSSRRGSLVR